MPYLKLALVALGLMLPLGALQITRVRAQAEPPVFDSRMPDRLGEWRVVREGELAPDVVAMLAPEAYSMRLYSAENRPPVWVYVAFYRGIGPTGAHDLAICYPAQGWTIAAEREVQVSVSPEQSFPARFMRTEIAGAEELVVYWFQPIDGWPGPTRSGSLGRMLDRVLGQSEYAFVRISLRQPPSPDSDLAVDMAALKSLAEALAPWARDAVGSRLER